MLDHANYDQAVKLVNDEAFSKNADGAARYFAALPTIPAGILYLKPIRFEVVNEGKSVNWMEYSVTAIVPASLVLAAGLNPNERPCPSHALGSLPARSPSFGSRTSRFRQTGGDMKSPISSCVEIVGNDDEHFLAG